MSSLGINYRVTGLEETKSRFDAIKESAKSFTNQELSKISEELITDMQTTCPVDTGFLRDNIEQSNSSTTAIQVASRADYSIYVEMGTRHMQAEPFFWPAVNKITPQKIADDFKLAVGL